MDDYVIKVKLITVTYRIGALRHTLVSVINYMQTNRVFALSAHSYFCLNTAQYIHVVEYGEVL